MNPGNLRQHIKDGVGRWHPFDHMENLIPEYSLRKSDLTQQAKIQVEQKFFAKSFCKFEMCAQFFMKPLLFPIPKKVQGVAIIFKHFYEKFFFSRAFQAPLKSNIKFQGFSRTSRSSTNNDYSSITQYSMHF